MDSLNYVYTVHTPLKSPILTIFLANNEKIGHLLFLGETLSSYHTSHLPLHNDKIMVHCMYVYISAVEVEEYSKSTSLRYYQTVFEAPFLSQTKEYYLHMASKLVRLLLCISLTNPLVLMKYFPTLKLLQ